MLSVHIVKHGIEDKLKNFMKIWRDKMDWWDDEEWEEEPECFGNYIPGDETCDFRCEWRDICMEVSGFKKEGMK